MLRGHELALRLHDHGYRVNFTLMFEAYQTPLALQARPYFINAFIRHRHKATRIIAGQERRRRGKSPGAIPGKDAGGRHRYPDAAKPALNRAEMNRPPRSGPAGMKAPPPPRKPHGQPRSLTEDERKLWEKVAQAAQPLKAKQRRHKDTKSASSAETGVAAKKAARASDTKAAETGASKKPRATPARTPAPASPPPLARQPSPLTRKERSRIARGRDAIAARLDLHGMTQTHAHRALHRFVCDVHDSGGGVILIITGKGRTASADSERGILRRQVPHWLASPEFRGLVSGFESAHVGHGGDGALYVRVRRPRARE